VKTGATSNRLAMRPLTLTQRWWGSHTGQDLKRVLLPAPLRPMIAEHLALLDLQVNIFERPERLAITVTVIDLTILSKGIGSAELLGPHTLRSLVRVPVPI